MCYILRIQVKPFRLDFLLRVEMMEMFLVFRFTRNAAYQVERVRVPGLESFHPLDRIVAVPDLVVRPAIGDINESHI